MIRRPTRVKNRPVRRRRGRRRLARGSYMVEALVALTVGAIIACSMTDMFGGNLRTTSLTQNECYAHEIVNELVEYTKNENYEKLYSLVGPEIKFVVNNGEATSATNLLRDVDPLLLDQTSKSWSARTLLGKFVGAASYRLETGPVANSIKAYITVTYPVSGSTTANATRTVTSTYIRYQGGSGYDSG